VAAQPLTPTAAPAAEAPRCCRHRLRPPPKAPTAAPAEAAPTAVPARRAPPQPRRRRADAEPRLRWPISALHQVSGVSGMAWAVPTARRCRDAEAICCGKRRHRGSLETYDWGVFYQKLPTLGGCQVAARYGDHARVGDSSVRLARAASAADDISSTLGC